MGFSIPAPFVGSIDPVSGIANCAGIPSISPLFEGILPLSEKGGLTLHGVFPGILLNPLVLAQPPPLVPEGSLEGCLDVLRRLRLDLT